MNNIPRIGDKIINGKLVRKVEIDLTNLLPKENPVNNTIIDEPEVVDSISNNTISNDAVPESSSINGNYDIHNEEPTLEPIRNTEDIEQVQSEIKEYSITQFKDDYEVRLVRDVLPILSTYESERKVRLACACAVSGILIIIALFVLFGLDINKKGDLISLLIGGAGAAWFAIKKSFEKKIKRLVMPILMRAVPDFSWLEKPPVTVDDMHEAKIFPLIPKCKVMTDDCFKGKYRNVNIDITECEFNYGKKNVFQGAVIKIDMNKNFEGTTVIRPKQGIEFKHTKDLKKAKLEKIELEDININKKYDIYSTDQIEARYLLTTSFIERFNNITMAFNSKVAFCAFHGKHVYIAPYCKKDLFSIGSLIKPVSDSKQFITLFNEFVSVLKLVDHFKLDKKLGL